jgi:HEAT repeat protein
MKTEIMTGCHVSKTDFQAILLMILLKRYISKSPVFGVKWEALSVAGESGMATQNREDEVGSPRDESPSGNVDQDLKKTESEMKARVAEVPRFIQLVKNGELFERIQSAEFLGEIGDERGVLPLIDALKDPSTTVQYVAAKSLGMLRDRRAVDALIRSLRSGDKWVRLGAAHALGLIGDKKAVDDIIPLLTDPHHDLRAHAAWALGKLMDVRAVDPLKRLLQDPKADVRAEAKNALDTLAGTEVP